MKFPRIVLALALLVTLATNAEVLPAAVAEVFAKAKVPLDNIAVIVKEVGSKDVLIMMNADKSMNPASVIKLVTTYAGLELLGPAYTWKTEVFSAGEMRGSSLRGDLVLKGKCHSREWKFHREFTSFSVAIVCSTSQANASSSITYGGMK